MKIPMAQNTPGADSGDYIAAKTGHSFTATKASLIFPLGSQINFPAALRLIREDLLKSARPWGERKSVNKET